MIEVPARTHEHEPVCGRNPAVAKVFAVAVARDYIEALLRLCDHFFKVVTAEKIIRVEYEIEVEAFGIIGFYAPHQKIERIALPHLFGVGALIDNSSELRRRLRRAVRTVIGDDEDLYELIIISLPRNALYEVANDALFISGGNQHGAGLPRYGKKRGVPFLFPCGEYPLKRDERELVGI